MRSVWFAYVNMTNDDNTLWMQFDIEAVKKQIQEDAAKIEQCNKEVPFINVFVLAKVEH